jgi:hypothetical protein
MNNEALAKSPIRFWRTLKIKYITDVGYKTPLHSLYRVRNYVGIPQDWSVPKDWKRLMNIKVLLLERLAWNQMIYVYKP